MALPRRRTAHKVHPTPPQTESAVSAHTKFFKSVSSPGAAPPPAPDSAPPPPLRGAPPSPLLLLLLLLPAGVGLLVAVVQAVAEPEGEALSL